MKWDQLTVLNADAEFVRIFILLTLMSLIIHHHYQLKG